MTTTRQVLAGAFACAQLAGCVSARTNELLFQASERPAVHARTALPWSEQSASPARGAPAVTEDELARGVTRDTLVAIVLARDATLSAMAARVEARVHGARASGEPPAPEADFQVWNVPFRDPFAFDRAEMYMLQVRQPVPAPGRLDADARAGAHEAHALHGEMTERASELTARVDRALVEWQTAGGHHHVHARQLEWIRAAREALDARVAGGESALAEIARLESESARTERAIVRFESQQRVATTALNALLLRPLDAPLVVRDPRLSPDGTQVFTIPLDRDTVIDRALHARGMIAQARDRIAASALRTQSAQIAATVPDLSFAFSLWLAPAQGLGYGLTFAMTLPWLSVQGRERAAEAVWDERASLRDLSAANVEVRAEVAAAFARLRGAEQSWRVQRARSVPAAERAVEAAQEAFVSGGGALLPWLDTARELLDARADLVEAAAEVALAAVELERAAGVPLERAEVTP